MTTATLGHNNPPSELNIRDVQIVERAVRAVAAYVGFGGDPATIAQKRKGAEALSLRQWLVYGLTDDDPERGIIHVTALARIFGFDRGTVRDDRNFAKAAIEGSDLLREFSELVAEACSLAGGFVDLACEALTMTERARASARIAAKKVKPRIAPPSRAAQLLTELGRFEAADRADDLRNISKLMRTEREKTKEREAAWKRRDRAILAEDRRPRRKPPAISRG